MLADARREYDAIKTGRGAFISQPRHLAGDAEGKDVTFTGFGAITRQKIAAVGLSARKGQTVIENIVHFGERAASRTQQMKRRADLSTASGRHWEPVERGKT